MFGSAKQVSPELVLACQVNSSFETTKKLENTLQQVLDTSVLSFDFERASLVLIREGKPPVWWHAAKHPVPDSTPSRGCWVDLFNELNLSGLKGDRLLEPMGPVAYTTMPVILQADDPLGVMEVGIFDTDAATGDYMLNKAVSLGRHMADTIQESLFEEQKDRYFRKLSVWLEMISTISSTLDIQQVLHVVTQLTADLFSARCCIYMLDEHTQRIIPAVAVGSYDNKLKEKFKALKNCQPFPALTMAMETQRPVIVNPSNISSLYPVSIIEDFNYRWVIVAPIVKQYKVHGLMQVDRPDAITGFDAEATEIIFTIARTTAIALENAKLVEELGQKEQLLHHLVDKIITAQEDERKRLASDLHDGIIQSLIAIWYRLQRITSDVQGAPVTLNNEIINLTDMLGEQIQDIRRILYDLRPIILDNYGLVPAVQSHAAKIQEQNGIKINLSIQGEDLRFSPQVEITLFRIIQEALNNVIKHSGATMVDINFAADGHNVQMSIRDNGAGFKEDQTDPPKPDSGLGLVSIQERALLLNGACTIDSWPGQGAEIKITVPINTSNRYDHLASDRIS
ncbi:MAG: GAF domain-containing sensor histidine kinase [Firmicutes bacterium]|nr:GAF domain-containing sensor histidine kinase [Bacillota bacterium]